MGAVRLTFLSAALLCCVASPVAAQVQMPARAFWRAYDDLATAKSTDDSLRILFHTYENEGSRGHDRFMMAMGGTFEYLEHIRNRKDYLAWWRKHAGALDSVPTIIARTTTAFQKLVPGSKAPVFVVSIGLLSGAVIAFDSTIAAIAIDVFLPAYNPPTEDLSRQQQQGLRPFADIARATAVALADVNSKDFTLKGEELLSEALTDGVKELFADLVTGAPWAGRLMAYGNSREAAIWREFQSERKAGLPPNRWFDAPPDDRPTQLGRYVGYRIARTYLDASKNRTAALRRLLAGGDPLEILRVSGYER